MQISKISAQSFGCKNCKTNCENENRQPSKSVAISRNALIATLVGALASCQNCDDKYYFGITPEGNPYIFNQDGDSIDVAPRYVEKKFEIYCEKHGK